MQRPFNEEQDKILSRSFDATNNAINYLNANLEKLIFTTNIHDLILGIIIAILLYQNKYSFDKMTNFVLWVLLIIDLSFIMILPRRRHE